MKIVVVVSWCPLTESKAYHQITSIVDTFLKAESFAGHKKTIPVEFKDYCGFLIIKKSQQIGLSVPCRPLGSRYGFKRTRRKLQIEPLNLPPEESRAFGTCGADPPKKDPTPKATISAAAPVIQYEKQETATTEVTKPTEVTSSITTTKPKLNFPKATGGAISISRVKGNDDRKLDF